MSKWIPVSERLPEAEDARGGLVWVWHRAYGSIVLSAASLLDNHKTYEAWMPLERPAPYVKPRRFVVGGDEPRCYVDDQKNNSGLPGVAFQIPTREAAERIADEYERAYDEQ